MHFLWVNFLYLDTQYHEDLTVQKTEEVLYVQEHIPYRLLSKFTFEKEIEAFAIETNLREVKWLLVFSYNPNLNAIDKAIEFYSKTYVIKF